jgi:colicin import membrane protein
VALYRQAEREVREARRREREQAEQGRGAMLEGRRCALAVEAATHAAPDWSEAETIAASGEASFATEAYVAAGQAFEHGAAAYRRAETLAREAMRARADAEKRREAALVARRSAAEAQATKYASEPWQAAEGVQARASAALERQAYGDAQRLFVEARQLYSTQAAQPALRPRPRPAVPTP